MIVKNFQHPNNLPSCIIKFAVLDNKLSILVDFPPMQYHLDFLRKKLYCTEKLKHCTAVSSLLEKGIEVQKSRADFARYCGWYRGKSCLTIARRERHFVNCVKGDEFRRTLRFERSK